jgi:adapter protein MecA 1/2
MVYTIYDRNFLINFYLGSDNMKIEKINDNQIRCTLNSEDLASRQIKLSELAYGTDKAKELFREMMQQASYEFGFEADNIPLMIEAIPTPNDSLILIITKVSDPEELDTRFSKFAQTLENTLDLKDPSDSKGMAAHPASAEEIIDLFASLAKKKTANQTSDNDSFEIDEEPKENQQSSPDENPNIIKTYRFSNLDIVNDLAKIIIPVYHGLNSLYKNPSNNQYYLVLSQSDHSPEEFNRVCNILSDYGTKEPFMYASLSYYDEHYTCICADHAVQVLAEL